MKKGTASSIAVFQFRHSNDCEIVLGLQGKCCVVSIHCFKRFFSFNCLLFLSFEMGLDIGMYLS